MINPIIEIKDKDIKKVAQLQDRPNLNGAYGQAKLTAKQLKEWFDQYPDIVKEKVNEILGKFAQGNGDFIRVDFPDAGSSLADMVSAIVTGAFANELIVKLAENSDNESLVSLLNGIKAELAKNIVTSKIEDGAVTTEKLATSSVTTEKLAASSVTAHKIAPKAVNAAMLDTGAVTTDKISAGAVTEGKIASGAITTDKIANRAVTTEKLGDYSVTSGKISMHSVSKSTLTDDVASLIDDSIKSVSYDKTTGILAFRTNANKMISIDLPLEMLVESGAYDYASKSIVLTLANKDKITIPVTSLMTEINNKLRYYINNVILETESIRFVGEGVTIGFPLTSLVPITSITTEKIADWAVTTDKLHNDSVTENKIAARAVSTEHLQDYSVTEDKLADGDVTTVKLRDGAVITDKISTGAVTRYKIADKSIYPSHLESSLSDMIFKSADFEKRIENLEGLLVKTITDSFVAYSKSVPEKVAHYAAINKVGGMTYKTDEGFRDSKVTEIVSKGVNLFDINKTTYVAGSEFDKTLLPKVENGVMYSSGISSKGEGSAIYVLLENNTDYTLSCDVAFSPQTTSAFMIVKLIRDIVSIDGEMYYDSNYSKLAGNLVKGKNTVTFNSEKYKAVAIFAYSKYQYGVAFSNIMLNKGTTAIPYSPYSSVPIDTLAIPQQIRQLTSFGKGIDAIDYNYIDFDEKQYVEVCGEIALTGKEDVNVTENGDIQFYSMFSRPMPSVKGICTDCEVTHFESKYNSMILGYNNTHIYWVGGATFLGLSTEDEVKTYLANRYANRNPVRIIYKRLEPYVLDMSRFIDAENDDNFIEVVGGGYIVAVNEHEQAVPSSITYITKS